MNSVLILITVASLALAIGMGYIAWHVVRAERRRSEARVAALTSAIGDEDLDAAQAVAGLRTTNLFGVDREADAPSRTPIVVAAGALVVATVLGLAVFFSTGRAQPARPAGVEDSRASTVSAVAQRRVTAPIELIALDHERSADGLTVRGIVRNPANGLDVTHLTAVVLLFNSTGNFVATGRGAVVAGDLLPGAQASFVVSVPGALDVGRYRVSFRTDDDHVVPHVDKRDGA